MTIATPSPLNRLQKYLAYGLDHVDPKDHRGARLCNVLSLVGTVACLIFGGIYLAQSPGGLWAPALVCFFFAPFYFCAPLLMRFGIVAAAMPIILSVTLLSVANTYLMSREAGLHSASLIIAPAVGVLLLGVRRIWIIAVLALFGAASSLIPEIYFVEPSPLVRVSDDFLAETRVNIIISNGLIIGGAVFYAVRRMVLAEEALEAEYDRSERLLENLLPRQIASRLKATPDRIIADDVEDATILFADIVGFTPRAAAMPAEDLVRFLNRIFTAFDAATEAAGLEKIKTIGDAYMVAAGLPTHRPDHAAAAADLALELLAIAERLSEETDQAIEVRIGLHTGPVVAGVIGTQKFFYDVWGDTVNTAARMESHGQDGRIQISAETHAALGKAFLTEPRGVTDIKGKGPTETWWLKARV
ncbi:MAG: adenylate/guanylate cyclase domain-containing protein [Pseudomonadota bacterium]